MTCPYANMQLLYPAMQFSTIGNPATLNSFSCNSRTDDVRNPPRQSMASVPNRKDGIRHKSVGTQSQLDKKATTLQLVQYQN
jgi:hypothetical protein